MPDEKKECKHMWWRTNHSRRNGEKACLFCGEVRKVDPRAKGKYAPTPKGRG